MVNEKIAKEKYSIKKGEEPRTRFIDNINAVKVFLLDWPDSDRLKEVFVNFSTASWERDFYREANKEDIDESISDLLRGKMLAQGIEHPTFAFRVEGLSLHGTHSLVRNRIGICYLQRSLATTDLRHSDILLPRALTKNLNFLQRYKRWAYLGKQLYSDMLDSGEYSVLDARMILPKTIPSWINVSVNLATLLSIYSKRSCSQEEHPEMNEMVKQMKDLVIEKFSYMKEYFKSACDSKTCLHTKPGYKCNCIFKRDILHKSPDGVENWTLHNKTKKELMLDCEEYVTEHYIGPSKVTEIEWKEGKINQKIIIDPALRNKEEIEKQND